RKVNSIPENDRTEEGRVRVQISHQEVSDPERPEGPVKKRDEMRHARSERPIEEEHRDRDEYHHDDRRKFEILDERGLFLDRVLNAACVAKHEIGSVSLRTEFGDRLDDGFLQAIPASVARLID